MRHQASTGVTTNPLTGIHSGGSRPCTSTVVGSSPTSSVASRSAVSTGSVSPGSAAPPGNAGWPAWLRMSRGTLQQQDVGVAGRLLGEQDEHGAGAAALGGRDQPGEVFGARRGHAVAQRRPPVGEGVDHQPTCTPRY